MTALPLPYDVLSDGPLREAGPFSRTFAALGVADFHGACHWLQALPYGRNSRSDDLMVLFEDGCGTCTTKHGVAAALAEELGLPARKYIVFYRLDERIRAGIGAHLATAGVEFVPNTHCVLGEGGRFADLTHGNRTGKRKDLVDFELYVQVEPGFTADEQAELYDWGVLWYRRRYETLRRHDVRSIRALRRTCLEAPVHCDC